ncbi:NIPSNAP family protein [Variovorax sp. efr-133-TYG-130]|uniref:NIPSNAP family protein n=1 Tax=Variovorax sp. efr-133-TYG-130 TaxID=3040327 RepID=UPI0025551F3E|nr:NIPSNAP family protein [Variovorax sp. efr-133-TYG-130]
MIYEIRTYTAHPGKLGSWLPVFEAQRLPLLLKHLGNLVGAFTPDTGKLNQLVQIWAYKDYQDRADRRAALWADPEWTDPSKNTSDALQAQESVILTPTKFSPMK